jgi:hypothetical protein
MSPGQKSTGTSMVRSPNSAFSKFLHLNHTVMKNQKMKLELEFDTKDHLLQFESGLIESLKAMAKPLSRPETGSEVEGLMYAVRSIAGVLDTIHSCRLEEEFQKDDAVVALKEAS